MKETINVKYPDMRFTLGFILESLSSPLFQWQSWIEKKHIIKSSLDATISFLFDDTDLSSDPYGCIGYYLITKEEATTIQRLVTALINVINIVGETAKDEEYIRRPEWVDVLDAAHEALKAYTAAEFGIERG